MSQNITEIYTSCQHPFNTKYKNFVSEEYIDTPNVNEGRFCYESLNIAEHNVNSDDDIQRYLEESRNIIRGYFIHHEDIINFRNGVSDTIPNFRMYKNKFTKSLAKLITWLIIVGRAAENQHNTQEICSSYNKLSIDADIGLMNTKRYIKLLNILGAVTKNNNPDKRKGNLYHICFSMLAKLLVDNDYGIKHIDDPTSKDHKFTVACKLYKGKYKEQHRFRVRKKWGFKHGYTQQNDQQTKNCTTFRSKNYSYKNNYSNKPNKKYSNDFDWVKTKQYLHEQRSKIIEIALKYPSNNFSRQEIGNLLNSFTKLLDIEKRYTTRTDILTQRWISYLDSKIQACNKFRSKYGYNPNFKETKLTIDQKIFDCKGEMKQQVKDKILNTMKNAKKYKEIVEKYGENWQPYQDFLWWIIDQTYRKVESGVIKYYNQFIYNAREYLVNFALKCNISRWATNS